jgi:hypothetical protein
VFELHIGSSYAVDNMASAERQPVIGVWGSASSKIQGQSS